MAIYSSRNLETDSKTPAKACATGLVNGLLFYMAVVTIAGRDTLQNINGIGR